MGSAALPPLLLLLLLLLLPPPQLQLEQLIEITMTESMSRHSRQLPGPESCRRDEYWSSGHCCKSCPAGTYVGEPCRSPHTWGTCVECEQGTFTAHPNGLDSCLTCSTCRDDQEVVVECSSTRDRMCQCRTGQFYQDPESLEFCSPCSRCPSGIHVLQACNATVDTVCGSAAPSGRNRLWSTLCLLPALVFFSALVYLCHGQVVETTYSAV